MTSTEPASYSVTVFLPRGLQGGLRLVEKSNWVGEGALFPRSVYPDIRSRDEFSFNRAGIYLLWEPADTGDLPRVYIGQADPLRQRLDQHLSQKDFWTRAVAFSAKDQNLNRAHVQHIEARLIRLAAEVKQCRLENGNAPRPPSLSLADKAQADAYLSDMMLCLPVLGIDFFERIEERRPESEPLFIDARGVQATGYEGVSSFVVKAGSQATKQETRSIHEFLAKRRQLLLENGVLQDKGASYEFVQDHSFSSPTMAAGVVLGRATNGRTDWKDSDGRTLKRIQEEQLESN